MNFKNISKPLFYLILNLSFLSSFSCDSEDNPVASQDLANIEKEALLFMLEEEKLARDTYEFLYDHWGLQQFANIKRSEQSHMDAVENLLLAFGITYQILPEGEFANTELQTLYDQFILIGIRDEASALTVGATIEDLDIVDLQDQIESVDNSMIVEVFQRLKCGSENHLRAFVGSLENLGESYDPQFLDDVQYLEIINSQNQTCN